jgi:hypothetical protein
MAIRYAVANGNWSNTATWDGGTLPTASDDVFANNFTVTIDGTFTVLTIRNTANTTPSITAGGFFTFANGGNLTCTNSSTSLFTIATSAVLRFSLGVGNSATFNGNQIGGISGVLGTHAISHSGLGTLSLLGNYEMNPLGVTIASVIVFSSSGVINIIGTLSCNANVTGGNSNSVIRVTGGGTVNVLGNVFGNTLNNNLNNTSIYIITTPNATVNITGDITGISGTAISNTVNCSVNHIGTATASSFAAIATISNILTCNITGLYTASTQDNCIRASIINMNNAFGFPNTSTGFMPFLSPKMSVNNDAEFIIPNNNYITDEVFFNGVKNIIEKDIREGVVLAGGTLTGTLAVPTPDNVRKGVPTDDTLGTADLTAEDFFDAIAISTNDIAIRLRNVATVETTGDQIANL